MRHQGTLRPLTVAQMKVQRVDGSVEYRYSHPALPWWDVKRRYKVRRHVRLMKSEED